jgi:hypothetical protein
MSSQQPYNFYQQIQQPIPQDLSQPSGYPGTQQDYQLPQQGYSLPPDSYGYQLPPPQDPGRGAALAGLILSIGGLFFFPAAIAGLVMSIIGLRSVSRRRQAMIGLVLSSIIVGVIGLYAIIEIIAYVATPQ